MSISVVKKNIRQQSIIDKVAKERAATAAKAARIANRQAIVEQLPAAVADDEQAEKTQRDRIKEIETRLADLRTELATLTNGLAYGLTKRAPRLRKLLEESESPAVTQTRRELGRISSERTAQMNADQRVRRDMQRDGQAEWLAGAFKALEQAALESDDEVAVIALRLRLGLPALTTEIDAAEEN